MSKMSEMSDARVFVSLDTSTRAIGYAFWDNGFLIDSGAIKVKKNSQYPRLIAIAEEMEYFFNKNQAPMMILETAFFGMNPSTTTSLALVQGAVIGAASLNGVEEIFGIPPITWQTGIGNSSFTKDEKAEIKKKYPGKSKSWYSQKQRELRKYRTMKIVSDFVGRDITDDDEADAIGIGLYVVMQQKELRNDLQE